MSTIAYKESLSKDAVQAYFNKVLDENSSYKKSFQETIDHLQELAEGYFLEDFGGFIEFSLKQGLSNARVNEAMKALAKKTKGKFPAKPTSAFSNAVTNEALSFDFEVVGDAAIEVGKSVLKAGNAVNTRIVETVDAASGSVVSILDNAKWIIPALLFIGVIGYIYIQGKTKEAVIG